jgi:hypothetical protein
MLVFVPLDFPQSCWFFWAVLNFHSVVNGHLLSCTGVLGLVDHMLYEGIAQFLQKGLL